MNTSLLLPVKDVLVTQPFGTSFLWWDKQKKKYVDFYKNIGFDGHMGIDFLIIDGCKILAAHTGTVIKATKSSGPGLYITIMDETRDFKTTYAHLQELLVKEGDKVKQGQIIAKADNTGIYTTGSHLHFEMKLLNEEGYTKYPGNGYGGCIDPAPYFIKLHGKKWYEPAAYHRYGRRQDWLAEFKMRFKNRWLHKKLIKANRLNKINDTIFINKLVYGGWSYYEAINPAMNYIANYLKKSEYKRGIRPFE